mmetsp:Transcript_20695/g.20039  ORF Transcript_20695/g.20039 Transcript_20695/m.20039 type:complete len:312 (+) Transcript_20695:126-1061(+)|eukprot:CAMPEP_0119053798 /NCGR_PEP_ID=MMETSP1177-20130426/74658_1 /TAXON_ID=2985 /ORGANISM="Ochromonas sp, Strain CCMP1899" /LENGTH=311 /DNA_ID=CAMNT_0007033849 /DNA_START=58 /DNA_END=993 /DNA_ORIENTATION=-
MSYTSKNHIDSIDVSSSGKRIILGLSALEGNTWDGGLTLLSNDCSEICSKYSPAGISMVRFSGSRLILAARDDGHVVIYSADKLEEMQVLGSHDDIVSCVVDDPHNESQFASCGWDGNIHLWDWRLTSTKQAPIVSYIKAHHGHVNDVKYSPFDVNSFSSVGWDGFLRIWDRRENPSNGCASIVNVGQIGSCVSYESKDENMLLVGTDAGDIALVDGRNNSVVSTTRVHTGRVRRILASPTAGSGSFVSASDDTTYAFCSRDKEAIKETKRMSLHSDYVTDLSWGCDSDSSELNYIYSVSTDKTLRKNTTI